MDLLEIISKAAAIVSLFGYLGILFVAYGYHDGRTWQVWRLGLVSGMLTTAGALVALYAFPPPAIQSPRLAWVLIGLAIVTLGRLVGALCNFMLAVHLRRLVRPRRTREGKS